MNLKMTNGIAVTWGDGVMRERRSASLRGTRGSLPGAYGTTWHWQGDAVLFIVL
jgi:hypothetical protein